MNNNTVM